MCGIFGIFLNNDHVNLNHLKNRIIKTKKNLEHRGPDDHGVNIYKINKNSKNSKDLSSLIIGHTRLSIIDLSSKGRQPMESRCGRYCLTFNGEIYNYLELKESLKKKGKLFYTNTDTEVLMSLWDEYGLKGLKKIIGMFAFAIYDNKDHSITIARDAFGIKPLFFYKNNNLFCFASEITSIKSLLSTKIDLNLKLSCEYLLWGLYDHSKETFLKDVFTLLPGHYLKIKLISKTNLNSQKDQVRWWWPSIKVNKSVSYEEAVSKVRQIFLKNIKLHLRSDVPIGINLSGGIDSSAITACVRYLEPNLPIHTFSYIPVGSNLNEEKWIDIVNNYVNATPHKVYLKDEVLYKDLIQTIDVQGEPFGSASILAQYKVFETAKKHGIKVILDGQGADELLAGYNGYVDSYSLSLLNKSKYYKLLKFLSNWVNLPGRDLKLLFLYLGNALIPFQLKTLARRIIGQSSKPNWLNLDYLKNNDIDLSYPRRKEKTPDSYGRQLMFKLREAITSNGLSSLLRHADRNAMKWSIENRVPFLTIELAEYLLSLPESFILSEKGITKNIFRDSMRDIVPREILERKDKIGFDTPNKTILKTIFEKKIHIQENKNFNFILKKDKSIDFISDIVNSSRKYDARAWRIMNFMLWHKI